ncbi:MAG TPA: molybdopterin-dependent oxidoreductase [Kofleriaceae bacterium]|nr:molybdopterin-dependent oxidoreductase [Kofleriaceae bacterium]
MSLPPKWPDVDRSQSRRDFIKKAAAGTLVVALGGGLYRLIGDDMTREARAQKRKDGRPRLPPGQRVIEELRPMGGEEGSARTEDFQLRVHGEVDRPFTADWKQLLAMPVTQQVADVHCVTAWTVLGSTWTGVQLKYLAERAGLRKTARHVILEAAHGYTANIRLDEAMAPNSMVAYQLNGKPFPRRHGAPVRGLVPDLYFWKSPKWLTGIRFVTRDEPGYWETRGYHNHADPWREERYG